MGALPSFPTSEAALALSEQMSLSLLPPAVGFHQMSHFKDFKSLEALSTPSSEAQCGAAGQKGNTRADLSYSLNYRLFQDLKYENMLSEGSVVK